MNITREQMDDIATEAVKKAFRDLGIQDGDPFEMRKDFLFLREWRETCQEVRAKGTFTLVGLVVAGMIALLVIGFKDWIFH